MKIERKENVQYATAIFFLFTGIIVCFLSFFLNEYDIKTGALTYLGEATAFTAGVFSINLYVKNKVNEAEIRINKKLREEFDRERKIIQEEEMAEEDTVV